MTRLGAGSRSCSFVNNIMEVCLFLCPLEIFPLVRDVSQPVCLPLFLCVRTCRRVFVCVCVHSRGAGVFNRDIEAIHFC